MKKEACFLLGYIASKYSFKGELLFKLDTDEPEEYENMESVFVAIGANLVPYFILERSWHKSMLRVRLQGIETETDASNLIGSELYLPLTALKR
jgi:16S rRNA processing protein RimM